MRLQTWRLPGQTKQQNKTINKINKNNKPSRRFQKGYRRRFGATRGQYIAVRQTHLRPQIISTGGDYYFNNIRKPPGKAYRIVFQNLGEYPLDHTRQITDLREVNEFKADFIGLQEAKLNETHKPTIAKTDAQFHKYLGAKSYFKSNNDLFSESYWKPGGLASLTMKSFQGKGRMWTNPTALMILTRIKTMKRS